MKKLIRGIINFRKNLLGEYRKKFSKLVLGQTPDVLLIACCDSRVVPNIFASTDPGDLFVLRNIGNLVPPYGLDGSCATDSSVVAAIEYSVLSLNILDIIVCGHSECGAMAAFLDNKFDAKAKELRAWLQYAEPAYKKLQYGLLADSNVPMHNKFSQLNVIQQVENLKTYPYIADLLRSGQLRIHGWWFDLAFADIYRYDQDDKKFILIDENEGGNLLTLLDFEHRP